MCQRRRLRRGLERAEIPFDDSQFEEIGHLGNSYEEDYAEIQDGYTEDTPRLRKIMDEMRLKSETMSGIKDLLSEDQRSMLFDPMTEDRLYLDLLSPLLMGVMATEAKHFDSIDRFREKANSQVVKKFDLTDSQKAVIEPAVADYGQAIDNMNQNAVDPSSPVDLQQALAAGLAQAALMESLLALPDLNDTARSKLLETAAWPVPRLKASSERRRQRVRIRRRDRAATRRSAPDLDRSSGTYGAFPRVRARAECARRSLRWASTATRVAGDACSLFSERCASHFALARVESFLPQESRHARSGGAARRPGIPVSGPGGLR